MVEMRGVDLRCGAGRLGLRHAPGMSPRALGFNSPERSKQTAHLTGGLFILVEMRGVEPLSESTLTKTSPGADGDLHSLA